MVNYNLCDMWLFNWYLEYYLFIDYCSLGTTTSIASLSPSPASIAPIVYGIISTIVLTIF